MLRVGAKAPAFALKDKDGKVCALSSFKAKYTIVYFYPKDNTPGCTIEAILFSKSLPALKKLGAAVIGISGGDEKSKSVFCEKHNLSVLLLSDPEFKVSKKYGVYGEKSFMGRKFNGITRSTFVLDKNKKAIKVFENANPATNPSEIVTFLSSFKK